MSPVCCLLFRQRSACRAEGTAVARGVGGQWPFSGNFNPYPVYAPTVDHLGALLGEAGKPWATLHPEQDQVEDTGHCKQTALLPGRATDDSGLYRRCVGHRIASVLAGTHTQPGLCEVTAVVRVSPAPPPSAITLPAPSTGVDVQQADGHCTQALSWDLSSQSWWDRPCFFPSFGCEWGRWSCRGRVYTHRGSPESSGREMPQSVPVAESPVLCPGKPHLCSSVALVCDSLWGSESLS